MIQMAGQFFGSCRRRHDGLFDGQDQWGLDRLPSMTANPVSPDDAPEQNMLLERIEMLESELEHALRRVNRLTGERNQLATLLEQRDERIQALNRELGALARAAGPGYRTAWAELGQRLLTRLSALPAAPAPEVEADPVIEEEERKGGSLPIPLIVHSKTMPPRPVLAVAVFGLDAQALDGILPVIQRQGEEQGMMPLLLTDDDAFEKLRARRMVFEYLPPAADRRRFDPTLRWETYLQRRLAVSRRKWQPARVIAFGKAAAETVELWRDSPFEDTPLPTSLSGHAADVSA
jgi:hypothetical protein